MTQEINQTDGKSTFKNCLTDQHQQISHQQKKFLQFNESKQRKQISAVLKIERLQVQMVCLLNQSKQNSKNQQICYITCLVRNVTKEWKHRFVIKLAKMEISEQCKNWRGITLLSVPGEVLNRIVLDRIKTAVDLHIRYKQSGFRSNRSCTDQIAIICIIIEQSIEWNTSC